MKFCRRDDFISDNVFTDEEMLTIKIDILHICGTVSLSEKEAHKRKGILDKIKKQLGDK